MQGYARDSEHFYLPSLIGTLSNLGSVVAVYAYGVGDAVVSLGRLGDQPPPSNIRFPRIADVAGEGNSTVKGFFMGLSIGAGVSEILQ